MTRTYVCSGEVDGRVEWENILSAFFLCQSLLLIDVLRIFLLDCKRLVRFQTNLMITTMIGTTKWTNSVMSPMRASSDQVAMIAFFGRINRIISLFL